MKGYLKFKNSLIEKKLKFKLNQIFFIFLPEFLPQALTASPVSYSVIVGASLACIVGAVGVTFLLCWVLRARVGRITVLTAPAWLTGPLRRGGKGHVGLNTGSNGSTTGYNETDVITTEKGDDSLTTPLNSGSHDDGEKQAMVNELGKHFDAESEEKQ